MVSNLKESSNSKFDSKSFFYKILVGIIISPLFVLGMFIVKFIERKWMRNCNDIVIALFEGVMIGLSGIVVFRIWARFEKKDIESE
jgi:hypothetical protein